MMFRMIVKCSGYMQNRRKTRDEYFGNVNIPPPSGL